MSNVRDSLTDGTEKLLDQLEGDEKDLLIEEMRPIYNVLKRGPTSRQISALDKLFDVSSTPTPGLTNESNSPQSSGRPSTSSSAAGGDAGDVSRKDSDTEEAMFRDRDMKP